MNSASVCPGSIRGYAAVSLPEPWLDMDGAPAGWYVSVKRLLDFSLALALLVLTGPIVLLTMAVVKVTSPGPAIYRQVRLGRFRRPFTIYKIRTMADNCEALTGAQWATANDPRVTPIGRFLRRTHLDELPQLWNILRGDMSLVGPRPERPEFVTKLEAVLPRYENRMLVRPGVTGLAQVQLPPDTDLDSVRRKLVYDLFYIAHDGLWLDLRLLFCTGLSLLGIPFRVSCPALFVPGSNEIELRRRLTLSHPLPGERALASPRLEAQTSSV